LKQARQFDWAGKGFQLHSDSPVPLGRDPQAIHIDLVDRSIRLLERGRRALAFFISLEATHDLADRLHAGDQRLKLRHQQLAVDELANVGGCFFPIDLWIIGN
jgi:hypothetical protein